MKKYALLLLLVVLAMSSTAGAYCRVCLMVDPAKPTCETEQIMLKGKICVPGDCEIVGVNACRRGRVITVDVRAWSKFSGCCRHCLSVREGLTGGPGR